MPLTGTDIGNYIDPNMIDSAFPYKDPDPLNPSDGFGTMGLTDVPLVDGRIAIVDSNGVIAGYK